MKSLNFTNTQINSNLNRKKKNKNKNKISLQHYTNQTKYNALQEIS